MFGLGSNSCADFSGAQGSHRGQSYHSSWWSRHERNFGDFDRISAVTEPRRFPLRTWGQVESPGLDQKNIKDGGHQRRHCDPFFFKQENSYGVQSIRDISLLTPDPLLFPLQHLYPWWPTYLLTQISESSNQFLKRGEFLWRTEKSSDFFYLKSLSG